MVTTANPIADFHCQAVIHARRTRYPHLYRRGTFNGSNAGIYVDNQSGNNIIDGNEITLITDGAGHLYDIYFAGANSKSNTIENNTINGGKRAFQQDDGFPEQQQFIIISSTALHSLVYISMVVVRSSPKIDSTIQFAQLSSGAQQI